MPAYTIKLTEPQAKVVRMAAAAAGKTIAQYMAESADQRAQQDVAAFVQNTLPPRPSSRAPKAS